MNSHLFAFDRALHCLKEGGRVARLAWSNAWIELEHPNESSLLTAPYIYVKTADHKRIPWTATHADLLASDWCAVHQGPQAA